MLMLQELIPFHKPYTNNTELEAVNQVLKRGILRGDGPTSKSIQKRISDDLGAKYVFFTTSCTHALEMAIMCLNLQPGDEVIIPSFTFVSTANAVLIHGGKPVFADILHGTLNLDPEDVARKITSRTRAIIPVHYAGVSVEMDKIAALVSGTNIIIIEDAAQGVDAFYKSRALGTIGDMGCFSFHDTKNITCGEGGAFVTNSEEFARKAEIIREKGTNRSAFLRGEVDKYTWIDLGSSYIQSDILAGVLDAQWSKRAEIKTRRKIAWSRYLTALKPFSDANLIELPEIPEGCESNYHIFFITTRNPDDRDPLLDSLKASNIQASFHYVPLHSSPFGKSVSPHHTDLPVTDRRSRSLIRLPLYPAILEEHPNFDERVSEVFNTYFNT
jgi:dTDP-4-amino-4,6-dideoxygalactose transaminase